MPEEIICEFCGLLVEKSKYERHILTGHKDKNDLKCKYCTRQFTSQYNLESHIAQHINARSFLCEECPKTYNTSADLNRHMVRSHTNRVLKCDQCQIEFPSTRKFNQHMNLHLASVQKGSKECSICNKAVNNFDLHYRTVHLKLKSYTCDQCGKEFARNKDLNRHIRDVHEKIRPHKCEKPNCKREFSELSQLLKHLDTHEDGKMPHCSICKKDVEDICEHYKKFHDKLFCKICFRTFTRTRNIRDHNKLFHSTERSLFCDFCPGRGFISKRQIRKHMRQHRKYPNEPKVVNEPSETDKSTTEELLPNGLRKCPICSKEVKNLYSHNRVIHLKIKSPECSACGRTFATKSGLDRHWKNVHTDTEPVFMPLELNKTYKCDFDRCNWEFPQKNKLISHMKIHTKTHNYCKFCKKCFDNLKEHYEVDHSDLKDWCYQCNKPFSNEKTLSIHMRTSHDFEHNFICDLCPGRGFAEKYQIAHHIRRHLRNAKRTGSLALKKVVRTVAEKPIKVEPPEIVVFNIKNEIIDDDHETNFEPRTKVKLEPEENEEENEDNGMTDGNDFCSYSMSDDENEEKLPLKIELKVEPQVFDFGENDLLRCKLCKENFHGKDNFKTHFMSEHVVMHNCKDCNENFPIKTLLTDHREKHKQFKCTECDKVFYKSQHLKVHFSALHTNEKFHCSHCDKSFGFKRSLDYHVKAYHSKKDEEAPTTTATAASKNKTCNICGQNFYTAKYLKLHVLAKHSEKQFQCEFCEKKFSFELSRDRHRNALHLNQRPFQCEHCDKNYASKRDLAHHTKVHHTFNPADIEELKCDLCDKRFTTSQNLKRHHQTIHENLKLKTRVQIRQCKFCKETFGKAGGYQLKKHILQVHKSGLKPKRTCQHCNVDFVLYEKFKEHLEANEDCFICIICGLPHKSRVDLEFHGKCHKYIETELRKFMCDLCPSRFPGKASLMNHMKSHMKQSNFYVCDICGQGFKYAGPYHYHKKVHKGQKDFVCTFCGKAFILKSEMVIHTRKHTQEKPFRCLICDDRFASQPLLKAHLQTHPATRTDYSCTQCNLNFYDRKELKVHEKAFHLDTLQFSCNVCKESFRLEHVLRIHMNAKHKHEQALDYVREDLTY